MNKVHLSIPQIWLEKLDVSEFKLACTLLSSNSAEAVDFPSISEIAQRSSMSPASVKRAIARLQEKKVITEIQKTKTEGGGFPRNVYLIDETGENLVLIGS